MAKFLVTIGGHQYNTEGNKTAHTFKTPLSWLPLNAPIKTNGRIYVILKRL